MESDEYHTIKAPCKGLFKVKGSKHYGFIYPILSEADVAPLLASLRKEYHDARHHAYAYRLGYGGERWRASDDGEPSNSAGPPILGALRSLELTGCLAVVVRYFGGTKLGVGRLIEAYREATLAAISNGSIDARYVEKAFVIQCPYGLVGGVMSRIDKSRGKLIKQDFSHNVTIEVHVRVSLADDFERQIAATYGCHIKVLNNPQ